MVGSRRIIPTWSADNPIKKLFSNAHVIQRGKHLLAVDEETSRSDIVAPMAHAKPCRGARMCSRKKTKQVARFKQE